MKKVRSGVSFDHELLVALDKHAENLKELGVDRSELVNAILGDYLEENSSREAIWGSVTRRRVKARP